MIRTLVLRLCLGGEAASQLCLGGIEAAHLVGRLLPTTRAAFLSLGVVAGADEHIRARDAWGGGGVTSGVGGVEKENLDAEIRQSTAVL